MSYQELEGVRNNIAIAIGCALLKVEGDISRASGKVKTSDEFAERALRIHKIIMDEMQPDLFKVALMLYDKTWKESVQTGYTREKTKEGALTYRR